MIAKNNKAENSKRIPHMHKTSDQVMLKIGTENKCEQPFSGPHKIFEVHPGDTARLEMGAVTDTVNIRRIEPFQSPSASIHGGSAVCGCLDSTGSETDRLVRLTLYAFMSRNSDYKSLRMSTLSIANI